MPNTSWNSGLGRSGCIEQTLELTILVVAQLAGQNGPLSGQEQQLAILGHVADLIGREERATNMLLAERDAGGLGVERPAHGLENHRFMPEHVGDQAGALVVVDPEYLHDARVREECAGALPVGGAQLMHVLEDGPELEAVAGHQPHGALDRVEAAERCEFVEQVEDGRCGLLGRAGMSVRLRLRTRRNHRA